MKKVNFWLQTRTIVAYAVSMLALAEIAKCFENNRIYSEKQVNEIISKAIGFEDIEMIRRELYESKMINRKRDGSEYWLNDVSGTGIEI